MDFFATTTVGLEKVLAQEIKSLPQASRIVINKGWLTTLIIASL
jgi:23S rRNA G2445 N2-methylase RlmL